MAKTGCRAIRQHAAFASVGRQRARRCAPGTPIYSLLTFEVTPPKMRGRAHRDCEAHSHPCSAPAPSTACRRGSRPRCRRSCSLASRTLRCSGSSGHAVCTGSGVCLRAGCRQPGHIGRHDQRGTIGDLGLEALRRLGGRADAHHVEHLAVEVEAVGAAADSHRRKRSRRRPASLQVSSARTPSRCPVRLRAARALPRKAYALPVVIGPLRHLCDSALRES